MWDSYEVNGVFDEMFAEPGVPRGHYAPVARRLTKLTPAALDRVVGGTDTLIEADDVDPGPCTPLNESCCRVLSYGAPPRTRGC